MLSELAFELAAGGMDVRVITSRQRYGDAAAQLPGVEQINGVHIVRIWTTRFGRNRLAGRGIDYLTFYISAFFALLIHARAGDTIVAKTDPPMISVIAALAAMIKRARLINWLQDIFPEATSALGVDLMWPIAAPLRILRNWSLRKADHNVVLGAGMASRVESFGIARKQIRTIFMVTIASPAAILRTCGF